MTAPDVVDALLDRHGAPAPADLAPRRLVDVATVARTGDWSLRAALVRVAQPEPLRASAVLELVRRLDGSLDPHRRELAGADVVCDPGLGRDGSAVVHEPVADHRAADLARLLARHGDGAALVQDYVGRVDDPALAGLADALVPAVGLDELGELLAAWAEDRDGPPPIEAIDAIAATVHEQLGARGVARETGPPRRSGR